jgi:membrane-bound lytic murein transglycosylase D
LAFAIGLTSARGLAELRPVRSPVPSVTVATARTELAAMREADRELFAGVPPEIPDGAPVSFGLPGARREGRFLATFGLTGLESREPERDVGWIRELKAPDLSARWDARVLRYLDFYRSDPRGRGLVQRWFRKSGRYGNAIRRALREQGLPEDLVWLVLVESGFDPTIRSPAGAAGLWQLMTEGARAYGLCVDRYIDERLDPERSTEAAARYLADLYRRFGGWELALAAYNMGDGGLLTAMRKYNTNDYWELSGVESGIPYETALYVPKIIAMSIVAHNGAAFGIEGSDLEPEVLFDSILVPPGTTTRSIATAARIDARAVDELNPQLRGGKTPPAAPPREAALWTVRVPLGKGRVLRESLGKSANRNPDWYAPASPGTAVRPPVDFSALDLRSAMAVRRFESRPVDGAPSDDRPVAVVPAHIYELRGRRRVFYRVVPGDTVGEIAGRFGLTEGELCRFNVIDPSARLHEGLLLQAFPLETIDLSRVAFLRDTGVRLLTVGSDEFFDYFEALRGRRRTTIIVEQGDTWERLAKRLHLTVGQLERINQRSHVDKLLPKQTLVVYAPVGRSIAHEAKAVAATAAPSPDRGTLVAPRPDDLPPLPEVAGVAEPSASSP